MSDLLLAGLIIGLALLAVDVLADPLVRWLDRVVRR